MDYSKLSSEIKDLRRQVNSDFQFQAVALRDLGLTMRDGLTEVSGALKAVNSKLEHLTANVSERFTQLEGRTCLQEQRFDRILESVDNVFTDLQGERITRAESEEIRARTEKLEQSQPPAA